MRKNLVHLCGHALAFVTLAHVARAQFATGVASYSAGTGGAAGYNNPNTALGAPSTFTVHEFGGPVDPFNPAWMNDQIVSIGAGGSLTLRFDAPIKNESWHAYGMDFIIHGNSGFIYDNFEAGTTDGSLFGAASPGSTQVSVSADNITFYRLQPSTAPVIDRLYPTDGSGLFGAPVNPSLTSADFAGKNLAGIRSLYAGSAGGASFDIGWAQDASGNPVALDAINFVRIDVVSGVAEVDGIVVTPEPAACALFALGGALIYLRKRRS